uniref:NADH-ubiquinone oxidoreductase chain 6 n=1 Tax=Caenis sp. JYZ-2020 TaxID=2717116 RepID=A0A6G7SDD5_9INSE|nr:NADH dehydrogenase subunit 6 [Caenis sp. JYZ-2020]
MMTIIFCFLSFSLSLIFIFMSHPLAMGLSLLLQTLLLSMSAGLLLPTFWFSYILFLVFLGGMLVLFIYVASLASNEMFTISTNLSLIMLVSLLCLFMILLFSDSLMFNYPNIFMDFLTTHMNLNIINTFIFKMYNFMNYILTLMMIIYLLLALVIVANIVTVYEGPLRPLT